VYKHCWQKISLLEVMALVGVERQEGDDRQGAWGNASSSELGI
jgi:hypothetical protein